MRYSGSGLPKPCAARAHQRGLLDQGLRSKKIGPMIKISCSRGLWPCGSELA